MTAVLQRERDRVAAWADLDLPDPVGLMAAENLMAAAHGIEGWRHPRRAEIAAFIAENGTSALPAPLPNDY